MKSISQLKDMFGKFSRNSSTINLDLGVQLINDAAQRRLYGFDYTFLEETQTFDTVADEPTYPLPVTLSLVRTVTALIGDIKYTLQEVPTRREYDAISSLQVTSNIPAWYYIENNYINIYPVPSVAGTPIYINYRKKILPATNDDFVTGTFTFTNGGTTVTASSTLPTWAAVQGYVIDENGQAYDVAVRDSNTQLTLVQKYQGTTGAQAANLVQGIPFPNGLEYIPLYDALSEYYLSQEGKIDTSQNWSRKAEELANTLNAQFGSKSTNLHIPLRQNYDWARINPNNFVEI